MILIFKFWVLEMFVIFAVGGIAMVVSAGMNFNAPPSVMFCANYLWPLLLLQCFVGLGGLLVFLLFGDKP